MLWTRNAVGDLPQHLALSFNAVLILLCAGFTLRYAIARRIDQHRRWAIRLFLVVSGVWFFRIALIVSRAMTRVPIAACSGISNM